MQYLRKGYWVAAKKVKCRLNRIKVATFQHMINTPMDMPIIAALIEFTFPKYSGAKNKAFAPNVFMKLPLTAAKSIYQKTSITWYFLKCRKTN